MSQNAKRYTHVEKAGEYEIVGTSSGKGQRKGDVVIVYRDANSGTMFHREPEDFAMRMKPITKPEINAQLLAAAESLVIHALTTGGTPGPDAGLMAAIEKAQSAIAAAKVDM